MTLELVLVAAIAACVFFAANLNLGRAIVPREAEVGGLRESLRQMASMLGELPLVRALEKRSKLGERRSAALRQLPTMLDVITLGLSAGLSFDSSLELYCSRYPTELASAMGEAMLTWRIGAKARDVALQDLADELDIVALRRFAMAVSQALAFGSPLAAALEQQAQAIRDEQRSELEEQIEQVPVKMLIPLGALIVPAMLLAILGPLLGSSISAM